MFLEWEWRVIMKGQMDTRMGKIEIDKASCDGCGVCIQVCKYSALEVGK